jgi:glycosyltransferase involved in cell wall biosynthesis
MKKLLVHHHAVAYQSSEGIWIQSFIASWVNSLAPYFDQIGLLMHESPVKSGKQDTLISCKNVILESLGAEGRTWDRFSRMARIKNKCNEVSAFYDCLIIRGITPRGYTIFKHTRIENSFYLLVGSLNDSKPKFYFKSAYTFLMYYIRRWELKIMSKQMIGLSNSITIVNEFERFAGKKVFFAPTSSISEKDIQPFIEKKLSDKNLHLVYCGRITKDKGVFELFDSIPEIIAKSSCQVILSMIGSVDNTTKADLIELAQKGKFEKNIVWKGFIPFGKDLLIKMGEADICILPSYHEGFPHTIWEAGISSLPMITTSVGGIPGMVNTDMVTFIETKSPNAIVNAVLDLILDSEKRNRKAHALYKKASSFTIEKNASILTDIIKQNK